MLRIKPLVLLLLVVFTVFAVGEIGSKSFFGSEDKESCVDNDCTTDTKVDTPATGQKNPGLADDAGGDDETSERKLEPGKGTQGKLQDKQEHDHILEGKAKKERPSEVNVIITFTNAAGNLNLQRKFKVTVCSLLKHSSINLALHIIGDDKSQFLADDILEECPGGASYRV